MFRRRKERSDRIAEVSDPNAVMQPIPSSQRGGIPSKSGSIHENSSSNIGTYSAQLVNSGSIGQSPVLVRLPFCPLFEGEVGEYDDGEQSSQSQPVRTGAGSDGYVVFEGR